MNAMGRKADLRGTVALVLTIIIMFTLTSYFSQVPAVSAWSTLPTLIIIITILVLVKRLFILSSRKFLGVACIICLFLTLLSGLAVENLGTATREVVIDNKVFEVVIPGGWKWRGGLPLRWYYTYGISPFSFDKIYTLNLLADIIFWFCISLAWFVVLTRSKWR